MYMMPKLTHDLESHNPKTLSLADDQTQQPIEDKLSRTLVAKPLPTRSENLTILMDGLNSNPTSESGPSAKSKKKKKRGKKQKKNLGAKDEACDKSDLERENSHSDTQLEPLPPFTSSGTAMQNKIKLVYDEFVKRHDSKQLKLGQVVEFAKCLSDARNELQHRADTLIRKRVSITALLYSADRCYASDRFAFRKVRDQITKFNLENKRLKDDGCAYNFLQRQFIESPGYKEFARIRACLDEKEKQLEEESIEEFCTISFEEVLAKEKNDTFWQKNGKSGQCSSSN